MGGPKWIIDACDKIQGQITSGANSVAQQASITALQYGSSKIKFMINTFLKRRNLLYKLINKIPGFKTNLPDGAFYFFPDISYYFGKKIKGHIINNSNDFSIFLLEKANVAIVDGSSFGAEKCIRISYATSTKKIIEAMSRIRNVLL